MPNRLMRSSCDKKTALTPPSPDLKESGTFCLGIGPGGRHLDSNTHRVDCKYTYSSNTQTHTHKHTKHTHTHTHTNTQSTPALSSYKKRKGFLANDSYLEKVKPVICTSLCSLSFGILGLGGGPGGPVGRQRGK